MESFQVWRAAGMVASCHGRSKVGVDVRVVGVMLEASGVQASSGRQTAQMLNAGAWQSHDGVYTHKQRSTSSCFSSSTSSSSSVRPAPAQVPGKEIVSPGNLQISLASSFEMIMPPRCWVVDVPPLPSRPLHSSTAFGECHRQQSSLFPFRFFDSRVFPTGRNGRVY
jgi:hypothetical protein